MADKPGMVRLTFDAGTLVLHGLQRTATPPLPQLCWDPRSERYRVEARHYRALRQALVRGRVPHEDHVLHVTSPGAEWVRPDLRPYQHGALFGWHAAGRRGVAVLPTGSGKTRLACAAMASTRLPSLCLVPTRVLLHQWRDELARHYPGPVGCLGDGEHNVEHVTVATFEGAYRRMAQLGNRFGLLVVDEAHHFGAGVRDEALEMCAAPFRLGLTATAPADAQLQSLVALLGPVVCELNVRDLIGEWLADFDTVVLPLRLNAQERARYADAVATFRQTFEAFVRLCPRGSWSDFVSSASRSAAGRAALAAHRVSRRVASYPEAKRGAVAELLQRHRSSRVLIFTPDNDTAYAIAREHLVMPITCDIDRKERDQALAAFRAGDLRCLVSARVLNEGLDVPDADVAIVVGGVRGGREHVQRVGRLLRPAPNKHAVVYELVSADTHEVRAANDRRRALGTTRTR